MKFASLLRLFENSDKRERRRRRMIHERGRLGEAFVMSGDETSLHYVYTIGGVQYEASQDIAGLLDKLPAAPERLLGLARLKYIQNNPANSILICEEWSGLRVVPGVRQAAAGD